MYITLSSWWAVLNSVWSSDIPASRVLFLNLLLGPWTQLINWVMICISTNICNEVKCGPLLSGYLKSNFYPLKWPVRSPFGFPFGEQRAPCAKRNFCMSLRGDNTWLAILSTEQILIIHDGPWGSDPSFSLVCYQGTLALKRIMNTLESTFQTLRYFVRSPFRGKQRSLLSTSSCGSKIPVNQGKYT